MSNSGEGGERELDC